MELLRNTEKEIYGPRVYIFNLPAPATCRPTAWCLIHCPALEDKVGSVFEHVGPEKLIISRKKEFAELMIREIKRKKIRFVKLHSSGDFYSQAYVRKWKKIGEACPETMFKTSTKRLEFLDDLIDLNGLPNFVVRETVDPSKPKPDTNLPLSAIKTLPIAKNFFECIRNCDKCGFYCWYHKINESMSVFSHRQWKEKNNFNF